MAAVLIPLAEGVEEMEAVIVMDVLRRAGWSTTAAATGNSTVVTASRGVKLVADCLWDEAARQLRRFDGIVIPGGAGGSQRLSKDERVLGALREFNHTGKIIGAICAGPLVLQSAGILEKRLYTCYPGVESEISGAEYTKKAVVRDHHLITSQGPGTAFEFALALIACVDGDAAANAIRRQLVLIA